MDEKSIRKRIQETERYYDERAGEYEAIYYQPQGERRRELEVVSRFLVDATADRYVLEIASGTGYWTQLVSERAAHVTAVDRSSTMLAEARRKKFPRDNVTFVQGDVYDLSGIEGAFDTAMINFWISHVPRNRLKLFLSSVHERLGEGSRVVMADNMNVAGQGGEFIEVPDSEDTFKLRELSDGTRYRVLKNYLTRAEIDDLLAGQRDIVYCSGSCYYWLSYTVSV